MKRKQLLSILTGTALVLSLAACGTDASTAATATAQAGTSTAQNGGQPGQMPGSGSQPGQPGEG